MAIIVEYLLIVKKDDTFCESAGAFTGLLNLDSSIRIEGGKIYFQDELICEYAITSGEITSKSQRYYHVRFSANNCDTSETLDRFSAFLKVVRTIMNKMGGQPETLWDDISFHYSMKAYEIIHRVENLMRKLIANFMLVTVGKEWVDESTPREIQDAISKGKRKEYLNVLHQIDFIDLADLLLRPYSTVCNEEIHNRIRQAQDAGDLNEIRALLPQSNWTRYFSALVACDDQYLKKRWDALYELRCKVAHNAIVSKSDYEKTATLASELEGTLEDAIKKLPQVEVPQSEIEQVAENAASSVNETLGEFLYAWRELEKRVFEASGESDRPGASVYRAIQFLKGDGRLDEVQFRRILSLSQFRNHLVHYAGYVPETAEMRKAIEDIVALWAMIDDLEDPNTDDSHDTEGQSPD